VPGRGGGAVADRLRAAWDARQAEKAKAEAPAKPEASVAAAPPKTETVSLHQLKAESDARLAGLLAKADLESQMRGTKSQSYQFVPEKVVGGSAGPNIDKILGYSSKMAGLEGDVLKQRGDLTKILGESGGKAEKPRGITIGGRFVEAGKGIPDQVLAKADEIASASEDIMGMTKMLKERGKQTGGLIPKDPASQLTRIDIASKLANARGSGVPSESELKMADEALSAGPRQASAIEQIEKTARLYHANQIKRIQGTVR
jgi:hypothetical protein